jgi:hypothetical protein
MQWEAPSDETAVDVAMLLEYRAHFFHAHETIDAFVRIVNERQGSGEVG